MTGIGFGRIAAAFALALGAAAALAQVPPDYPSGYRKLITSAQREARVVIYSTMDFAEAAPLISEFESLYPGIDVQYNEMNSPEVYGRFLAETERDGSSADITWSSAMDLQIKLANDGYAEIYKSPETRFLPEWAVWHNEAYGTTFEPAVFVYNKKLRPPARGPQTPREVLQLILTKPEKYSGNVITYDIEKSAVGVLFLSQVNLAIAGFWNLLNVLRARN